MPLLNLKLKTRLLTSFGLIVLLATVMGAWGLYYMNMLNQRIENMYTRELITIKDLGEIKASITAMRVSALEHVLSKSASSMEVHANDISAKNAYVRNTIGDHKKKDLSQVETKLVDMYEASYSEFSARISDEVLALSRAGKKIEAMALESGPVKALFERTHDLLNDLIELNKHSAQTRHQYAVSDYNDTRTIIVGVLVSSLILGLLISILVTRNIARRIDIAVSLAGRVAKGDLTTRIDVRTRDEIDELLHSLKEMNTSLVAIVENVRGSTDSIKIATSEIVQGSLDLSRRTETQASSLEETAATIEHLTGMSQKNAEHCNHARELSENASNSARNGASVMNSVVNSIGAINASAGKIADVVTLIDEIAFQTNILALNAAVEAARAGSHGRGFSVVANEVRALAQRCAQQANEIKELIGSSIDEVRSGKELVEQARKSIEDIVQHINSVNDVVTEIAIASDEQTTNIRQINGVITQMDETTQRNAALAEESSAVAQGVDEQVVNLKEIVRTFRLPERTGEITTLITGQKMQAKNKPELPEVPKQQVVKSFHIAVKR